MEIQTQELHELFLLFGTYRYAIAVAAINYVQLFKICLWIHKIIPIYLLMHQLKTK